MTQVIIFFEIYAFIGWILECIYTRYDEKRWVNRGFLHGPFCPIYGIGAVFCIVFLAPLQSNMYIFIPVSILAATCLELFIGGFFERVFHATLWTYNHKRFNYKGKICLEFSILWGVLAFVFVKIIHPCVLELLMKINPILLAYFALFVCCSILIDLIISVAQTAISSDRLANLERIEVTISERSEKIKDAKGEALVRLQESIQELKLAKERIYENLINQSRHFINAYPHLMSRHYPVALKQIKEKINSLRQKKPKN